MTTYETMVLDRWPGTWPEPKRERAEERAAILAHCAGFSREEAERIAFREVSAGPS